MPPAQSGPDAAAESDSQVEVTLQLATHPVLATPLERTLRLDRTATILDLKHRLRQQWDGSPLEDGVTITKGARVLRDQESLDAAFDEELATTPTAPLVLNVIVRPSAWSTPFTSAPATPPRSASPDSFHDAPLPHETTPPPRAATDSPAPSSAAAVAGSPARSVGSAYTPGFFDSAGAASSSSPPAPATPLAPPFVSPTSSASGTRVVSSSAAITSAAGPYLPYLAHLQRLVPLQRALLLLNLQKAHAHYARIVQTGDGDALVEVEALLRGVGLWDSVEERVRAAEKETAERGGPALEEEFKVVQIGGLPYLLHTPPALLALARSPPSPSLVRARAVHAHLTTMLQLLVTLAPAAPAIAHGRTVTGRPTPAAVAAAHQVLARAGAAPAAHGLPQGDGVGALLQQQQGQQPRRRATLSVIINLEAVFALFVPLVLLSVKLGFLLWLFGRSASPSKRLVLGAIAVLWVVFEGWGILRRRQAQGRDRDRVERERRRAARAQGRAQQGGAAGAGAGPAQAQAAGGAQAAAGGADAAGRPGAAPAAARPTRRRVPASRASPKYWLNTLAAVGLVAEARELGLQPRYIAGRPVAPPSPTPPGPYRRALRNVLVATVLFFATLSPEVERKRRHALDKRERLLAERRARDGRDRVAQAQQRLRVQQGALHRAPSGVEVALTSDDDDSRQASRAGTPGPGARAHPLRHEVGPAAGADEREQEGVGAGEGEGEGEASSTGERLEMDAAGLRRRRMAALAQRKQAAGRARVPDAELFRDGGSEAYSSARAGATGSSAASGLGSGSAQHGEQAHRAALPPPVPAAAPQLPALARVAPAPAAALAHVDDEPEVDPEEDDVASASGDGASTSGDEAGVAGGGERGERIRPAGAEADEVDEVVALF